ncbi:BCLAF1 and THRAP3 family member 3 isoform X1 [Seriola lalandi dorsalis]|uniref:BCLAF1 and THRAP3 family member 3 n=1 Tax=Seriola lalandi dorsalis TaxID=1841481 RepID=A0A3B4XE06_SERLL|nr:BCLAF1 and THRAP3 family member 3 isoform X1 [Seriola lalandi dorsalis]
MSRPRSLSPHYRRFPWEEPDFDPYKVLAELDGNPLDRSHRLRKDPEEHWDYFREDMYPEGQRRSPPFPDDRQFSHQRRPDEEEFYHRRPSPHYDVRYDDRGLSPLRNVGGDGNRRRGGFKEHFQSFGNRGRFPHSPPTVVTERLPQARRSHMDHQQREAGLGWREEQGRGRGRFRDLSPGVRTDDQRGGVDRERGRRNAQGPNRDRRRPDPHQERNPPFKRQRREMDDANHPGYRNEEDFGEPRYSVDAPRDGFGGDVQGSLLHRGAHHSRPLVIEHDHGITESREASRWEHFDEHRDLDPDFDRRRSPRPLSSSQERFRTPDSRLDDREDMRGRRLQDNWRDANYLETRRSPMPQDRPNPMRYGNRDGSVIHKGRGSPRPARGRLNRGQGGRTGPSRNHPRLQQSPQEYQDPPHEEQRPAYRPFRQDCYEDPTEEEPNWAERWEDVRATSLDRHLPRDDLDPKMPRQRERVWNDQKTNNMSAVKEETLTIKVDMSRPVNQNSSLCYSSDRQLSLDLVNVGRQRLDFLPMLEHSGTYRETATHTGTFAQEIITLVHHVKEQYFRDDGVTLNERFSAPQKGGYSEEETEELTLDERFSSNRGFSLNMNSLLDDDEPLFSRLGPMQGLNQQPVRGPGDLRHDLERRRQERLEGVKVTIPGSSMSQRQLGPAGEPGLDYTEELAQVEDEGFSAWSEEQSRRRDDNMVPRRGGPYRPSAGPQRRNNRFGNRGGSMRRQNNRNNPAGPNW